MTTELATYETQPGFLAPVVTAQAALIAYQAKKDLIDGIMKPSVDFGVIPGSSKPTLLKAGAEKATSFFGLSPRFKDAGVVEDWTGEQHGGEPFFYYRRTCELWRGSQIVASVDGSCNSWEKKYRYRSSERICPSCGKPTIIKGKEEFGGGFLCYAKKGGCGAKYKDNDPAIVEQSTGQVKNPDVADVVNTILKMADKRALVAATLIATGLSEYFTQDIEDYVTGEFVDIPSQPAAQQPRPAQPSRPDVQPEPQHEAQPAAQLSASTPPGKITPQMLVDNGISRDIPAAAETVNKLGVGGKPAAEYWPRVILYRKWRDAGHDPAASAIAAIAGEQLP